MILQKVLNDTRDNFASKVARPDVFKTIAMPHTEYPKLGITEVS